MDLRDPPGFIGLMLELKPQLTRFAVVFESDGNEGWCLAHRISLAPRHASLVCRADLEILHLRILRCVERIKIVSTHLAICGGSVFQKESGEFLGEIFLEQDAIL